MMSKDTTSIIITLFILTTFFLIAPRGVRADSTSGVDASVKIHICGDGIAEGPEQCDKNDLAGNSCSTVGYTVGKLKCDIACDFDVSKCIYIPPPDPPEEDESLTDTSTPEDSNDDQDDKEKNKKVEKIKKDKKEKPEKIKIFDTNDDGYLDIEEFVEATNIWLETFKNNYYNDRSSDTCDINHDGYCNLVDFSILLYHLDR